MDDEITQRHAEFCRRLQHEVVTTNVFDEYGWAQYTALMKKTPQFLHLTSNAFLPREAYEGGWIGEALRRTLASFTREERHDDSAHDRREVSEGAFRPEARR